MNLRFTIIVDYVKLFRKPCNPGELKMKIDNNGRQWRLIERRPGVELWRADDFELMSHGWAMCLPGDELDHATWQTTTMEAIARQWFAQ